MAFFPSLKQNFIAYRSSKVSDCIFEIQHLWQSGFSRVYSNCCCSCSFALKIIKIGQSSHNMYTYWISSVYRHFKCLYKGSLETYWMRYVYMYIYIYISSSSCRTASTDIPDPLATSPRSSVLHPVSSHSCWMYIRAGRPAFARPCVRVHKSTSFMSSSLLLQQCPACLARLTWIVFVMGGRWLYNWRLVGCCRQDLFNIARSILV